MTFMMKSCVIFTLQGANNIGAFLQAYGLMTVLKRLEIDVKFGIYPNDKTEKSNLLAKVIRYIKTGDIKKLMYKVKTVSTYREIQSTLPTIDMYSNPFFDYAIIGSDEVWNIKSDNFVHYPSFLGHDINADKIVAYAACGNGVTTGDFARLLPCEDFSAFTSLSARDYDTVKCVEQVSKRTVMRVVDPTMLIDDFDIDIPQCPISNDFILVYSYGIE